MSKEVTKTVVTEQQVTDAIQRINDLNTARQELTKRQAELATRESDLETIKTIKGEGSSEYDLNLTLFEAAKTALSDAESKIDVLSYKKSELKPILDYVTDQFQVELRKEQETEYSIEIGQQAQDGKKTVNTGVKAYNTLMDYLYHSVNWDAKTAVGLMVLTRNMEENKLWVRSSQFDNVIKLRSANVMVLYRSVLEQMSGRGYETAKGFLECWANCGPGITNAVKEINKRHEATRTLGANLNLIEEEFERSEDDLPHDSQVETTQEEVAPEV